MKYLLIIATLFVCLMAGTADAQYDGYYYGYGYYDYSNYGMYYYEPYYIPPYRPYRYDYLPSWDYGPYGPYWTY